MKYATPRENPIVWNFIICAFHLVLRVMKFKDDEQIKLLEIPNSNLSIIYFKDRF